VIKHQPLDMGSFTETILLKKEYKCAFKKDSNGSLLNKTLVEDGLVSEHYLIQAMKVLYSY
jgi:hypothetical protein